MTPPRLTELRCPGCEQAFWIIDSDCRGMGADIPYVRRAYRCTRCGRDGSGCQVLQQAPAEFLLQPHQMYPMTRADFDHWVAILRDHFPSHPLLARLGTTFRPWRSEQARQEYDAFVREHPVAEMKDHDGARRQSPTVAVAWEWLEIMRSGEWLVFTRHDGGMLRVHMAGAAYTARCIDETGAELVLAHDVSTHTVREGIRLYLEGETSRCGRLLTRVHGGPLSRVWRRVRGS
jgi:hypothetical protein